MDDPRVKPLLEARAKIDLVSRGFTPLTASKARLEITSSRPYDAMLHVAGKTIAFKKEPHGYRWIGEQEIFSGVREYETPDGKATEALCFTYELEPISGSPVGELSISYSGDDPRLAWPKKITLAEAQAVLNEWQKKTPNQSLQPTAPSGRG